MKGCNYQHHVISSSMLIFCALIVLLQPTTSSSTKDQKQYHLSYKALIPSSKEFLSQINDQICSDDTTCLDGNIIIDDTVATNILVLANHAIIKNTNTRTTDEKSTTMKEMLLEAKELLTDNNTQKQCMGIPPNQNICVSSHKELSTSLKIMVDNNGVISISIDSQLNKTNAQEILISSAMQLNDILDEFIDSSPLWSITEEQGLNSAPLQSDTKEKMLSNTYLDKERIYAKSDGDDMIELWEYEDIITSTESKVLYINSNIRYLSNNNTIIPPSNAHAESFVHPALLNHPHPTRIAILSKMPLTYIQEVIKYTSVETIDVVGSIDEDLLDEVIDYLPELNDCSGYAGINEQCMENTDIITMIDDDVNEWLDEMMKEEEEEMEEIYNEDPTKDHYARYPKYDIIYIDAPSSSSTEELNLLSISFVEKITQLLDFNEDESMIVINSGHVPALTESKLSKSEELRYDLLVKASLRKRMEIDFEAVAIYEEELAQPFDTVFFILFYSQEESHSRFFRDRSTAFDIDIIRNFRTLTKEMPPTVLYDGPTHDRYKRPSRIWERWFCSQNPWKDYYLCQTFYNQFFNKEYHHFNTEVRDHPIKNRALYTVDKIEKGHFINADDDSTVIHVDTIQWYKLEKFIKDVPSATMYQELRDFIVAYGFETEMLGEVEQIYR